MTGPEFSFDAVFGALHDREPFPWQSALAERVVAGDWPRFVDVPTGLGKTSVVDIALYALACDATRAPAERTARTRIVLVVDRRLIVDAAYEHVDGIRARLATAADGPLGWMRERLCGLSGTSDPVVARRMRGGLTWQSLWADTPAQPVVLTATVDQFGSRLLFRGYGTSDWIKPIDAGLLGTDTLVLLDEAHLSQALVETVEGCRSIESMATERPLPMRPTTVVQMTATPSERAEPLIMQADLDHEVAGPRLTARKRAVLLDASFATSPSKAVAEAGATLGRCAVELMSGASVQTVLVTANTVAVARAAFDVLREKNIDAALVVGRARSIDREATTAEWMHRVRAGRARTDAEPFVVVATQTVEVGVDIDVDALVTEVAPLDSLVQRFGRVDRLGHLGDTTSVIVRFPSRLRDDPPPYGPASAATWAWLTQLAPAVEIGPKGEVPAVDDVVDMGTSAIRRQVDATDRIDRILAAHSLPPVVLSPAVATWRRTSPIPDPDEAIENYLHGVGRGQPVVAVAWRCDLGRRIDRQAAAATGGIDIGVPLGSHETVEIPLSVARRFLNGSVADVSDLESVPDVDGPDRRPNTQAMPAAVVSRGGLWVQLRSSRDIRPGDVLIVDSSFGGHDMWSFETSRSAQVVVDVAELDDSGQVLRLDEQVITQLIGRPLFEPERVALRSATREMTDDDDTIDREDSVRSLCRSLAGAVGESRFPRQVEALFSGFAADQELRVPESSDGVWLAVRSRAPSRLASDDHDQSSLSFQQVSLGSHLDAVGHRAEELARRCGVHPQLVSAVGLAARLHDLGKADPRFQAVLAGEPRWLAETRGSGAGDLLAKSGARPSTFRRNSNETGWPSGYRHEAVSLALVAASDDALFDDVDRELVEHLVASHHGRGRPLFPPIDDPEDLDVEVQFAGREWRASTRGSHPAWAQPTRFARLCDRYGSWGLAYLEAIVRLADISISKEGR